MPYLKQCLYCLALLIVCCFTTNPVFSQSKISIIPKPQQVVLMKDSFALHQAGVVLPKETKALRVAKFFTDAVKQQTGINLLQKKSMNTICFSYSKKITQAEGYKIDISSKKIDITAKNDTGLFWAVQSLRQLLPDSSGAEVFIPCMQITDAPLYGWRGNMLDVCRHFFTVEFIKKHIDMLSYYKINTFHWHLTDDQGWRIEIKKYPGLTKVGAWRKESQDSVYGGFYTQEQIKEVIEYAGQRNITVIPEIEMPGHCLAALAAYPELSCRKIKFEVANYWGVMNDVYCAGNEKTYQFLEDVLTEVMALFPSKYIHIGGDEAPKYRWQQCPDCQKKIQDEHLKNEAALQSYFIKRIQQFLQSKGRILIGWDEILEGGASPEAIIEVWRGEDKAKEAIDNKNKIIQTLYIDAPMSSLTLSKTFHFDPAVKENNEYVLGAECPLWAEAVTEFNADYMMYPRLQAFSEVLWSGKTSYDDFLSRIKKHYSMMDKQGILYGNENKPMLEVNLKYLPESKCWKIYEKHGNGDIVIHYDFNGKTPGNPSPVFSDSVTIQKPQTISVIAFHKNAPASLPVTIKIEDNRATGIKPVYKTEYSEKYNKGGVYGMTDGITGTLKYGDGTWLGWEGKDLEMEVDLGLETNLTYLQINCLQEVQSWIMLPSDIEFYISNDNINWQKLATLSHSVSDQDLKPQIYNFIYKAPQPVKARYVKVIAKNYGKLPVWHNGAGGNSWVFADEFIIR